MDLSAINPVLLIASLMVSATPILLAAIGETVVEKAGVLNLGVEGMMITGAVVGFAVAINSGSPELGFICAAIAGAALSLSFGFLTQVLLANQVATGLGLTLVGLGLSALIGKPYEGMKSPTLPALDIPGFSDIPILGPIVFSHDPMVYVSIALVIAVWAVLKYSRAGLILRGVGENHDAAHALGYKVIRIRLLAIMFGGACAGLGGAYLSLVRVPQWTEGMTCGCRLDRAGHRGVRQLEAAAGFGRCLFIRRCHRPAIESTGCRGRDPGRVLVDVAISDNYCGASFHISPRCPNGTCIFGPDIPRL